MSAHAFMLGELSAFKIRSVSVHNSVFCSSPPEFQSFGGNVSFFIPPSVGSFSSVGKSFSILQYLASLGFSNPLSTHVMLFVHFSGPQYLAIIFLIISIARKPSLSSDRTLLVVFLKLGSPSAFSSILPP